MRFRSVLVGCAMAALGLLAAGSALASVTHSTVTVTAPTGTYLTADQVTPHNTIALTGTSDGGMGDDVDINCYSGASASTLASNVPVQANHTFSFSGPLSAIDGQACVLRAVPSGDSTDYPPGSSPPFTGPTLAVGDVENTTDSVAPNVGQLEFYHLGAAQLRGAFDYDSLGGCTIDDGYVFDLMTLGSATLDYCNASFTDANGLSDAGFATPTRSELQVDGNDAYLPANVQNLDGIAGEGLAGFPKLTYSYSIDPATGNLALLETDQVVRCAPDAGTYPPTSSSCTSFAPAGVQVNLRISQGGGGRVATVVQSFSSTDGHSHAVDLLENNEFFHPNSDGELNFPWTATGLSPYTTAGQVVPGPATSGPGSFFVKGSATVADGGEGAPQGAVTFSTPPTSETIVGTTNNAQDFSWVDLHYARTVPPTGSVAVGFTYSNAFFAGEVSADATAAQAAFLPSVSISSPATGKSTSQSSAVVSGTAHDANGLSSVTVGGRSVSVGAGGAWSTSVPLSKGTNTITAVATNIFGNTAQSHITVSFKPVVVLSSFKQSHRKWRERGHKRKHLPPIATKFSFTLSLAAKVMLVFTEKRHGRTIKVGALSFKGRAGHNSRKFKGRLGNGHRLRPGHYVVTVTASADGVTSKRRSLKFTIARS